jgi:hypothetical protein
MAIKFWLENPSSFCFAKALGDFDGKVQLLIKAFNAAYPADDHNEYF